MRGEVAVLVSAECPVQYSPAPKSRSKLLSAGSPPRAACSWWLATVNLISQPANVKLLALPLSLCKYSCDLEVYWRVLRIAKRLAILHVDYPSPPSSTRPAGTTRARRNRRRLRCQTRRSRTLDPRLTLRKSRARHNTSSSHVPTGSLAHPTASETECSARSKH